MHTIRLWDFPTRAFHWLLVAAIAAAWFTGEQGGSWMIWHGRIGLFIIGLITFRLVWGFLGSTYSRFGHFVRGPGAIAEYLRGRWQGNGHNPLGALSVLGLLALTALQAGSGLFASNDDIGFKGFLEPLISSRFSHYVTEFHEACFNGLLILIGLHVAAILFYTLVKKDNLVHPMISGRKTVEQGEDARGGGPVALIVALAIALAVVWCAAGSWLPAAPTAPAASW